MRGGGREKEREGGREGAGECRFEALTVTLTSDYGVVPKGLLSFLGVLENAEISPCERLPEFNELRES